jgi:DNA-binding CsgD family transcriptional regulator
LFARTRRHLYLPVVMLVLSALILALLPTVAQAQEKTAATPDAQGTDRVVVVRPGDSLWSISSDLLGPNASPRQIAEETERIYALNRGLIGDDPNLIFANQELALPPAAGQPAAKPTTGAAREETGAARAASADRASQGTVTGPASEGGEASQTRADLPALRESAAPAVPAVRPLASPDASRSPEASPLRDVRSVYASVAAALVDSVAELRANWDRRLLGIGIIALTFLITVLMAWKLPMKRYIGASAAWGIPSGGYGRDAYSEPLDHYGYALLKVPVLAETPNSLEDALKAPVAAFAPKQDSGGSDGGVTTAENGLGGAGVIGAVRGRRERTRRKRVPGSRRPSRGRAMSGAYGREVHQALSRATLKTRSPRSARRRAGKPGRGSLAMEAMPRGHLGGAWLAPEPSVPSANGESIPNPRLLLLSTRQWETLELAAEGLPNAQIARRLFITESTVKQHLRKAYSTLGIRSRREAARLFRVNDQAGRRSVEEEVQS